MSDLEKQPSPISKQDAMRSIGQALAERRKARNLTVEKVGQVLKIRIPYLKAMEQGDWGELPGEVYARGFTRRYAVYLGLDADKLMAPYLTDKSPSNEVVDTNSGSAGTDASKGILVAVGVAAIFLIVLIKLAQKERKPAEAVPEPKAVATTASVVVPSSSAPAALPVVAEAHRIDVFSPYPLWLHVTADDKTFEGFIPQSSTWSWSAKGKFSIRLGHSRKVMMLFDGKPVELQENQKKLDLPS